MAQKAGHDDEVAEMILVTGATGFIGGHVLRTLLATGHDCVGVSRYTFRPETRHLLGTNADTVSLVVLDADDTAGLRAVFERYRPTGVVHVDALVDVVELSTAPWKAIESNVLPTMRLLELAREFDTRDFVYVSSIAVLPSVQYEPITARHPIILESEGPGGGFYGASKLACEVFALSYAESFDMNVRIVRPSAVYGFGMQWPIGLKPLIESGIEGRVVDLGQAELPMRDFTHVSDVAGIVERLLACEDAADRIFFAATGQPLVSENELIEAVRAQIPDLRVRFDPRRGESASQESRYRGVIDMTPVREQLGYSLRYPHLSDGLAEYIATQRGFLAR